jgi:O-antigen/teichoic acid export membrane protein
MIVSFPIFALTFSLAQPLTVTLIEQRYADSAAIMALLSLGYYFDAALGQNGLTLKVMGKVRYIVVVYTAAAVLSIILNLIFIPKLGAYGAAIGTLLTLVIFNIMKQAGLMLGTGINIFDIRYRPAYLSVVLASAILLIIQVLIAPPFALSLMFAVVAALAVVRVNRTTLDMAGMFPELLRFPVIRWLLGTQRHV